MSNASNTKHTTIADLQVEAHSISRSKGWWDKYTRFAEDTPEDAVLGIVGIRLSPDELTAKLALITTEVSEAIECVRDGDNILRFDANGKPEGLPSELADVVIRVADLCDALGIDLTEAVDVKMAYNRTRKHRHGGRKL